MNARTCTAPGTASSDSSTGSPSCHLDLHEEDGYRRLHGLHGRLVGDPNRLLTLDDPKAIREPVAALVLELPQREIGGFLPEWHDLVAQTTSAQE